MVISPQYATLINNTCMMRLLESTGSAIFRLKRLTNISILRASLTLTTPSTKTLVNSDIKWKVHSLTWSNIQPFSRNRYSLFSISGKLLKWICLNKMESSLKILWEKLDKSWGVFPRYKTWKISVLFYSIQHLIKLRYKRKLKNWFIESTD